MRDPGRRRTTERLATRCPTCDVEVRTPRGSGSVSHFPFCSARCRMADLDRWFTEEYRVPGDPLVGGIEDETDGVS